MNSIRNLAASLVAVSLACTHAHGQTRTATAREPGRVDVSTIPFPADLALRSATYTPTGKVLVSYARAATDDSRDLRLAVMDDDGTNMRPIFSGHLPDRPKDNGIRFMVFPDNKRIFLGDFVLECTTSLETCSEPAVYPVEYPAQVAGGDHISHRWSEMIVAPDNRHIAWTTLLSNYSAIVFVGALEKNGAGYVIADPRIISTLDPFERDPAHPDGVLVKPVRGGEVKQFVHGGKAISLVGAVKRDTPDSVVQHLASGALESITDTPGYTETTIFSPDEKLGITMTSRFSEHTDPAVLGLMPRPYPVALNMGLSMFAYTYAVTGVRRAREGNIGPALIDIEASRTQDGYRGVNLNTDMDWVYRSPMSWHPGSRKALWLESPRGDERMRMQVVRVPDHRAGPPVTAKPLPAIPYGSSDLSVVEKYAATNDTMDVKVYGRKTGHIEYRRTPAGVIEKIYVNFSDDGRSTYSGRERMEANPRGRSTYTANVTLSGARRGRMDLKMTFGPLGGDLPASLAFEPDASGAPASRGYVEYEGKRLNVADLVR